jgi:polysaccharide export outer membrane protein
MVRAEKGDRKEMLGTFFRTMFLIILCLTIILDLAKYSFGDEGLSNKDYIIGAEDVLDIQVWNNEDLRRTVEVSQGGSFTFPIIGEINAGGLSVFELEKLLKKKLSEGYLVNPQVTITVTKYNSQKVILHGEVVKPGSYVIKGRRHILELLSEAGGITERAGRIVTITRSESLEKRGLSGTSGEAKENKIITLNLDELTERTTDERFFVFNGESIYVSKAPRIYVIGEVNKPGDYRWEKGLTVHQAIALAGGPTKRGASNRTEVIRLEKDSERRLKPNLSDPVMPDDIVNVPESYF